MQKIIPFWQTKTLQEMTKSEWESVCDGCGKCCLHKLEDEDTGEVHYTDIACQYLNEETCRCNDYSNRLDLVPDCINLKPELVNDFFWLPSTCAYRLLSENKDLPSWHPLVSGEQGSTIAYGVSIIGKIFSEKNIHLDDYQEHIIQWVV